MTKDLKDLDITFPPLLPRARGSYYISSKYELFKVGTTDVF